MNEKRNAVSKRNVTLGHFIKSDIEIVNGLSKGEEIVVKGQQKLKDKMKVNIQ